jgi:hypothetical protein
MPPAVTPSAYCGHHDAVCPACPHTLPP